MQELLKEHGHKLLFLRESTDLAAESQLLGYLKLIYNQRQELQSTKSLAFFAFAFGPNPEIAAEALSPKEKAIAWMLRKIFNDKGTDFTRRYENVIKSVEEQHCNEPEIHTLLAHLKLLKANADTLADFINSNLLRVRTPFIQEVNKFAEFLIAQHLSFSPKANSLLLELLTNYYQIGLASKLLGKDYTQWDPNLKKRIVLINSYFPNQPVIATAMTIQFDIATELKPFLPELPKKIDTDYLTELQKEPKKQNSQMAKKSKAKSRRQRGGKKATQKTRPQSINNVPLTSPVITKQVPMDPYGAIKKRYNLLHPESRVKTLTQSLVSIDFFGTTYHLFNTTGNDDHLNIDHPVFNVKFHHRVTDWITNPEKTAQKVGVRSGNTKNELIITHRIPPAFLTCFHNMMQKTTFVPKNGMPLEATICAGIIDNGNRSYYGIYQSGATPKGIVFHNYFAREKNFQSLLANADFDEATQERITATWQEVDNQDSALS